MILKEGTLPMGLVTLVAAAGQVLVGLAATLPALCLLLYMAWLYWERRPPLPSEAKAVLAPVRGRVLEVVADRDPWLKRDVLRVRIGIVLPGIVPLRGPVEGKVMELFTASGMFGAEQRSNTRHASPDCYASWIRTDEGEDVIYAISSRWPVSRARFEHSPGERVGQGKRSGFFYFATVLDVLIPADARARTEVGARVAAGIGVLAQLPRT